MSVLRFTASLGVFLLITGCSSGATPMAMPTENTVAVLTPLPSATGSNTAPAPPAPAVPPVPTATVTVTSVPTSTPRPVRDPAHLPDYCVPAETDTLQMITETPASPYFVRQPGVDSPNVPTIIFLSGGSGSQASAQRAWPRYLAKGRNVGSYRVVLPYSVDVDYIDDARRTFKILDEVLACYGGDPSKVHLAGYSNGGLAAYALMLQAPDRFATLLGAPGEFPLRTDVTLWAKALAGHAVFNGVGANDDVWKAVVQPTSEELAAAGIDSFYVEFPGQGHVVNDSFDPNIFFDFWDKHS